MTMYLIGVRFAMPLFSMGVQSALRRTYIDRKQVDFAAYVSTGLWLPIIYLCVCVPFVIGFKPWISAGMGLTEPWILAILLSAFGLVYISILASFFQIENRTHAYGLWELTSNLFYFVPCVVLIVLFKFGWQARVWTQILAVAVLAPFAICYLKIRFDLKLRFNWHYCRHMMAFGIPLMPFALGNIAIATTDRILITNLIGIEATGYYSAALQLSMLVSLVSAGISVGWEPWLFRKLNSAKQDALRDVSNALVLLVVGLLALAIVLSVTSALLVTVFLGEDYQRSIAPFSWLVFVGAVQVFYSLITIFLVYHRKTAVLATVTIIMAVSNAAVSWLLVHSYGAIGAAYGTLLVYLVATLVMTRQALAAQPLPRPSVMRMGR